MAEHPPPPGGMVLTRFIVSDDVERSKRFYTEVLGGTVERPGDPVYVALANHRPRGGLDACSLAIEHARREVRVKAEITIRR